MHVSKICIYILCITLIRYDFIVSSNETQNCTLSYTIVNGKPVCEGETIFTENFNEIDNKIWKHIIKIPSEPDYEFSTYTRQTAITYVKDNVTFIKPYLSNLRLKRIKLDNCTGMPGRGECEKRSVHFNIIPSLFSGRLTTEESFHFKYGIVQIQAQLPVGDWILPELWLMPKNNIYGADYYESGKIVMAMARGNRKLICSGRQMGNQFLEGGITVGQLRDIKYKKYETLHNTLWSEDFHIFTFIWTPDNLSFLVDGELQTSVLESDEDTVKSVLNLTNKKIKSKLAPFDEEFYIHIGVSIGGVRDFPDDCVSNGTAKPWSNLGAKAVLNFWEHRKFWNQTWNREDTALKIKSITVTAL